MSYTWIKDGRVLEPSTSTDAILDVLIQDERILKIDTKEQIEAYIKKESIKEQDMKIIEAKSKWVTPGFVDLHVHLREPGFEHKETIATGTASAAKGGVTTICPMPNTKPVIDSIEMLTYLQSKIDEDAKVNVLPIGAITKGLQGEELAGIGLMAKKGIIGISDDGRTVRNSGLMKKAMTYANMFDLPVMCHCEDEELAGSGAMHSGKQSTLLGLKGIPREAEDVIVARDILLGASTGAKVHICHVSTKDSVDMIRGAQKRGIKVTAEACPHHFTLTDQDVANYDANTKMNPPLRSEEDRQAIIEGLRDGTIGMIATDHAPHSKHEKNNTYDQAPFGIIGLETAFSLANTELVDKGVLTPLELINRMSTEPAKLIGLDRGLTMGKIADITIVDPEVSYAIDKETMVSKSKNTPFHGRQVKGKVEVCMVAGKIAYS